MRVAASSAAWVGAGLALLAFGVGFLVIILPIARSISIGLLVVCFVLAAIAFYGAYRAHYHPETPSPVHAPLTLPDDSATVAALREHTAALRKADWQARNAELRQRVYGATVDQAEGAIIGRSSRAARRSRLEYEEAQKARHLEPKDAAAIIRKVSEGVSKLAAEWLAATPPFVIPPFPIVLVAIGTDRETLNYRRDLAEALAGGGLRIIYQEWLAGSPEYEKFVGEVTLLEDEPTNRVRPFIIDALRAAGINPREAPWPVRLRVPGFYDDDARLWLLIGQCR
jgi:hypothetical protein